MPTRRQWAAAVALFGLTVLLRLPVRWVAPLLPSGAQCVDPSGSLWSGRCARAGTGSLMIREVSWSLRPWLLLAGRLAAHVRSEDPQAALESEVRFGSGGRLELRGLRGSVAIGSGLLPVFPDGWSGSLILDVASADFRAGVPQRLVGVLDASGLRQRPPGGELGSYQLRFDTSGDRGGGLQGTLRDTSGPLAVAARLLISASGAYELNGTVMARAAASPSLAAAVAAVGPADATGRRAFSLAGSF
ncbi:MAG: type II secretion system protein N [Gammaproteobacteria bacterium]|nr:type II secretion system protein N [Gammaproteobacteria bacterium]